MANNHKTLFNKASILHDNGSVDVTIPSLVSDQANALLTIIPSPIEIKEVMMNLKRDSAPGHDGF